MPKKTRMLFALFITLPFIFCLKKEETALLDKYSDFIKQVEENEGEFKEKTDEEKEKILKDLENSISDLNEQIKVYIQEKNESPKEKVLDLMKQVIEITKYMKHKVCNKEDKNYEVCRGFKRKLMSNLLDVIEDNFGKCELTFEYVINLTEMPFVNLQYLTVLINSVMDNIDSIEKNKAEILSDLIKCLASYCIEYWPKVIGENDSANKPEVSEMYKNLHLDWMLDVISKLKEYDYENVLSNKNKENNNSPAPKRREAIYEEILDILKEIKASKQDNTMVIIVSCLATLAIIMGGFFLYRFIRRRKNSNIIENTKDLVVSENKLN